MTATVIPLFSRDRNPAPACDCYPHRLAALADRLRAGLLQTEGELLVSQGEYARTVADVLAIVGTITAETLPADEQVRP